MYGNGGINGGELPPAYRPYTEWTLDETAANSLLRLGPAALPRLEAELNGENVREQRRAAATLARMGSDAAYRVETLEALINALADEDRDPLVRRLCARALGQIGPAIWPPQPHPYRPVTALSVAPAPRPAPEPVADEAGRTTALRLDYDEPTSARYRQYEAEVRDYQRRLALAERAVDLLAELAE